MFDKLSNQAQRLLNSHTSDHVDNMWIVAFCYFLHHVYLIDEVSSLTTTGRCYLTKKQSIMQECRVIMVMFVSYQLTF